MPLAPYQIPVVTRKAGFSVKLVKLFEMNYRKYRVAELTAVLDRAVIAK